MEEAWSTPVYIENSERLSDPLFNKAPFEVPFTNSVEISNFDFKRNVVANERNVNPWCSRESSVNSKFRFEYVFGKEKWSRVPSGFQLKGSKLLCGNKEISFSEYVQGARLPPTPGLVNQDRSFKCLFSRTNRPSSSSLPSFDLQRETVANDLSSVWPGYSPKRVCQPNELDCANSAAERCSNPSLFRRFFSGFTVEGEADRTHQSSCKNSTESRLGPEFSKVNFDSPKIDRIFGSPLGPLVQCKSTPPKQASQSKSQNRQSNGFPESLAETNAKSTRLLELRKFYCPQRTVKCPGVFEVLSPAAEGASAGDGHFTGGPPGPAMVEDQSCSSFSFTFPSNNFISNHGFFRPRLGSTAQHGDTIRYVVAGGELSSQQCLRNVSYFSSHSAKRNRDAQLQPPGSERQSHDCGVSTERRWNQIGSTNGPHVSGIRRARSLSYPHGGSLHPRAIQLHRRSPIERKLDVGVAPKQSSNFGDFPDLGSPSNRPFRFQNRSRSIDLCYLRRSRPECYVHRCVQPNLEIPAGVGIPTSLYNPSCVVTSKSGDRCVHYGCPKMGKSLLEARPPSTCSRATFADNGARPGSSGHENEPPSCANTSDVLRSVADTGWSSLLESWDSDQIELLDSSWRKSTLNSYKPAWARWCRWAKDKRVNVSSPSPGDLARFLTDLFLKHKLSYSSICLHKSVVSTFCKPVSGSALSSHIIVKHTLKAISVRQPPRPKGSIWDVTVLTDFLATHKVSRDDSFYEVSKRTAIILLLCSGRRVHDLTLLNIDSSCCIINNDSIVFWPSFGSKTDNSTHRQSGWRLLKCDSNQNICPVYWVNRLLECSSPRRGDIKSLFISTCGAPKPATRTIIGGWIKGALKDAGIVGSPGSVRSAVASASWAENTPIDQILNRGNWQSAQTFHKYYKKEVHSAPRICRNDNILSNLFQSA